MKTNIGTIDRAARIIVGLLLIGLYALDWIGPWGLVGFVPLVTGLVRFCPLYRVLGVQTCSTSRALP